MILTKKIRLKPNKTQLELLIKSANIARFVYNWTINQQETNYKNNGKFISDNDLRKEITKLKTKELSFLNQVSNNVAKQAVKDCCQAYKRFFSKLSAKPTFKSKKKSKLSFYNDNIKLKVKDFKVLIEKIGWIKTSEQIPKDVKYSNPRISFDGKYWYLTVGIEVESKKIKLTRKKLGIDLGIKTLAYCSDKTIYKNINKTEKVKKLKKKIKRFQQKVSRKYEKNKVMNGRYLKSNNILKLETKIKLLFRKLSNIRKNYIHQVTTEIVKTKPKKVVMEDLKITKMLKNKHLASAISEQNFYFFITCMKYKCELNGIEFVQADQWFPSSKTCSKCGTIKKDLKLSDRVFKCECGFKMNRDLNAAKNLANYK